MQLLCLSLVVMRCQPLRRALGDSRHRQALIVIMCAFVINF
ncbi:hypothetical protein VCEM1676A_003136 [Vibrio cholerae O1 str. EM-1676A]|nr:hypothetical protein VCEM1676A_003136 [Vibrio cholerae O1 str. EM-1676A]